MNFGGAATKAWKDIWGCGQGIAAVKGGEPAQALLARLAAEYEEARLRDSSCPCAAASRLHGPGQVSVRCECYSRP
jgi:hypothetical protein